MENVHISKHHNSVNVKLNDHFKPLKLDTQINQIIKLKIRDMKQHLMNF